PLELRLHARAARFRNQPGDYFVMPPLHDARRLLHDRRTIRGQRGDPGLLSFGRDDMGAVEVALVRMRNFDQYVTIVRIAIGQPPLSSTDLPFAADPLLFEAGVLSCAAIELGN